MTEALDHEAIALTLELVACDSVNPQLVPGGAGEAEVAEIIARRLEAAGLDVEVNEVLPGRPNVVGRLVGTGDGPSLMLCGHLDVVGAPPSAFEPVVRDGRIHGRGTIDMKAGLAAAVVAAERLALDGSRLAGDVIVAAVVDEEWASAGAEALVRGYGADAAILPEQSELDIIVEHGGFAWFEVESRGRESAGIEPELGIDAIELAIPVLEGVVALDRDLAGRPRMPYGRSSVHVSTISGGTSFPVYPSSCVLGIERCTLPAETVAQAEEEMRSLLLRAREADSRFDGELRVVIAREAVRLADDHAILRALDDAVAARLGRPARHIGDMGWADSGILVEAGVPCAMFGPSGGGHHSADEWVDVESVIACTDVLEATARVFCGGRPATSARDA